MQASEYPALTRDDSLRAYRDEVKAHLKAVQDGKGALVDVRSPDEFSGKVTHMANYPQEGVLRGGHIPGARSIPWAKATNEDGTFKSADELKALYEGEGVTADKEVIAYCRIAERSSHSWFVLRELLGYRTCATTTAAGPSGATPWACPSRKATAKAECRFCPDFCPQPPPCAGVFCCLDVPEPAGTLTDP